MKNWLPINKKLGGDNNPHITTYLRPYKVLIENDQNDLTHLFPLPIFSGIF